MPETIRSDRADGRFQSTAGLVHHWLKNLRPQLAFNPEFSLPEFTRWQQRVRRRLRALLRIPRIPVQPAPRQLSDEPRDGYRLQRWELYPEPASVVPMLMLVPDNASKLAPAPGILCLPGSASPNELLAGEPLPDGFQANQWTQENAMALQFARRGMVALCIENPGTAGMFEPLSPDWRRQSLEMLWLGRSYEGISLFHKLTALEWFKTMPAVDGARLAACGHSLGAKPALLLGVLAPKLIKAVVWNSAAYDWRQRHVATDVTPVGCWHYIPDFIRWFDYLDLKAALAPRPLLVSEGGRSMELAKVKQAYALTGAPENFTISYVPCFRDPGARRLDNAEMPEGLSPEKYLEYLNVTDAEHFFHGDIVVPWLEKHLF